MLAIIPLNLSWRRFSYSAMPSGMLFLPKLKIELSSVSNSTLQRRVTSIRFIVILCFSLNVGSSKAQKRDRINLYSSVAASLSGNSIEWQSINEKHPKQSKRESALERAKEELQLSHVPEHMSCRDDERAQIIQYLRQAIKRGSAGAPLYISGADSNSI